jgi:hypothetical protein
MNEGELRKGEGPTMKVLLPQKGTRPKCDGHRQIDSRGTQ